MYDKIDIILGTKHQKEVAIKEPFTRAFNASLFTPTNYDTDQFGTFCGEIPRHLSPYDTAVLKAKTAAEMYDYNYAIASEGSFGPDPTIFLVPADIEWMSFVDLKNDLVIVESLISSETNFSHQDINPRDNYDDFLEKIKFGSHALMIRSIDDNKILFKGIKNKIELENMLKNAFSNYSSIRLETDMRAMMNPTRMLVISNLTLKLVARLQNICAKCSAPGFGRESFEGYLACSDCGAKTDFYQFKILSCIKCNHCEYLPRADGLNHADPTYCQCCNP